MLSYQSTPVQKISHPILDEAGLTLLIKREDMNNPVVSGNKWWKLKFNLEEARKLGKHTVLTFGGAYSNHLYATAAAAQASGLKSIGVVRGEEILPLNPTLAFATSSGMKLHYVSRSDYRHKTERSFETHLRELYGDFYLIPEGGTNALAVKGVREFAETLKDIPFDYVGSSVGTGGTLAGLIAAFEDQKQIIGFSALKDGAFLAEEVKRLMLAGSSYSNWHIETDYHFGGYGKTPPDFLNFLFEFEKSNRFKLDPLYTGKMMYGIFDLTQKGRFKRNSTILAIHTGGLQGWNGVLERSL